MNGSWERVLTKCGPLEKGMAKHFSRTSWTVWKGKKDITLKDELPRSVGTQYATGEEWRNNPRKNEEMDQSKKKNAQVWMCLMVEVKSNAVKKNTRQEPGMLGPWIKVNWNWSNSSVQNWNHTDYILCSQRWRSSTQSAKTRLGADCGSDHELLIGKFRLKLKKAEKTTRPFRYDLNQIHLYNGSEK